MHFLQLRMADDAQYEIRVFAEAINEHFFKPALPWTAPGLRGFCPQIRTIAPSANLVSLMTVD